MTANASTVPEVASTPSGAPATKKPTDDEFPGGGTFIVGEDIEAGVYRSDGPQGGDVTYCSWTRLNDATHEAGDTIAANGGSGPDTVTIKESDKAFSTSGCRPWVRVG
ncbi:hypothetical protein [Streptomyces sp. 11x1]|uniref:hypothetical protein n=1 Tax=Streptomyces sp. 11x1 TaxID=3038642 RepID=UPI0029317225|nr:hypothetical protein [Streptomyces sp. 11x1]WNZ10998.1 hypothetical protein P8T65_27870 [Streptomyces sp. 11x1]